jgi:plastocyanin
MTFISRRRFSLKAIPFIILSSAILAISCSDQSSLEDTLPDLEISATITINNIGASAWTVESIEGVGAAAETGTENPAITLEAGRRYMIVNLGAANHPLEIRDEENNVLIAEAGNGSLQNYAPAEVVVDSENGIMTFTLTGDLAAQANNYHCQPHPPMVGDLIVI